MTGPIQTSTGTIGTNALGPTLQGQPAGVPGETPAASRGMQPAFTMEHDAAQGDASVATGNAGEQIRGLLSTIDQLGMSRSQQKAKLEGEVRRLEGLATDDPARLDLANTRLLATLQGVQEVSFRVELATKVIDQVANGLRTISQTQV